MGDSGFLQKVWDELAAFAVTTGKNLLFGLLILFVGLRLSKLLCRKIIKSKGYLKLDKNVQSFLKSAISIGLNVAVVLTAITVMGVPMASIVALLGSCGLAIGLALQGSLSNFAAGVMLLIFHPFSVGDYISADSCEGTVEDIGLFYTTLLPIDNSRVVIPNATLSGSVIKNFSAKELRRLELVFPLAYEADVEEVKKALLELADSSPLILKEQPVFAKFKAYKDSSAEYVLRVWCKAADYWELYYALQENSRSIFSRRNIEIPFPQLVVQKKEK